MFAKLIDFSVRQKIFSGRTFFLVVFLLALSFIFIKIKVYLIGKPPSPAQRTVAEVLFDNFLATNDPQNLFKAVEQLLSRKLSSLSLKEQYILVDSLTVLSKLFPTDVDIKLKLAVVSFLFGAYSKSLELVESLRNFNHEDERLKELHILNLIVVGKYEQVSLLLESLKNQPSKQTLEGYLNFKKGIGDLAQLKENLSEPFLTELIKLAEARITFQSKDPVAILVKWFFENEVIGGRIKNHFVENQVLVIVLENFPVSKMPPQIKQVFSEKVKELLASQERIKTVKLIDWGNPEEVLAIAKN